MQARAAISVPVSPETAFGRFVEEFGHWWPSEYTWSQDKLVAIGIASHVGGFCTEMGPHGFKCDWGTVIEYAPPQTLKLAWQISPRREPVPDPEKASEVLIRFVPKGQGCEITLTHSAFERHGDDAESYASAMGSEQGWPYILGKFKEFVEKS